MSKRKVTFVVTIAVLWAMDIFAAAPFKIEESRLKNGLTVVTASDTSAPVATVQLFVDASPRNEYLGITGISHVAEHFFFLGSKKVPPKEFSRIIDSWGGTENAYTGSDYTSYWASVPKERVDRLIEMYADMVLNKTFPKDYFEKEIKVIQEERRLTDNNPDRIAYLEFLDFLFEGNAYGRPVIGYWDDLKRMTVEDVKRYWGRHYSVDNIVAVVAGDVRHTEVVASFQKWFGHAAPAGRLGNKSEPLGKQGAERRKIIEREGETVPIVFIGFRTVKGDDPDYIPLDMLASILSDGATSRFRKNIVQDRKLAQSISAYAMWRKEDAALIIDAEPLEGVSPARLEKAIYEELERIKSQGVGDWELQRVVNGTAASFISGFQATSRKANVVGGSYIVSKRRFGYYDDYLDRLRSVTAADIKRVAVKYLGDASRSVFIQLPKGGTYYGTKVSDLSVTEYKNAKRIRFRNGLDLYYLFSDEVPYISLSLEVGGGSSLDPKGREGTAALLAEMLGKKTKTRSEEELDMVLDLNAIDFSAGAYKEQMSVSLSCLSDKAYQAFDYLGDIVKNTVVDPAVLERERDILLSGIESAKSSPREAASRVFEREMFGDGALSRNRSGYSTSLKRIGIRDLEDLYRKSFNAKNTVITMVGDISLEQAVDLVAASFDSYPAGEGSSEYQESAKWPKGLKYAIVDMPWLSQAFIYIDGKGITRQDPGYNGARVMNYILGGGGFSSRLMDILRTEMGLAYSVRSSLSTYRRVGTFGFSIQTKSDSAKKAIDAFFAELDRFRKDGATEKEFADAKSYYVGSLPFMTETVSEKVGSVSTGVFYGMGPDLIFEDIEKIKEMKIQDVKRQTGNILKDRDYLVTIVGNKTEILKQLGNDLKYTEYKIDELF